MWRPSLYAQLVPSSTAGAVCNTRILCRSCFYMCVQAVFLVVFPKSKISECTAKPIKTWPLFLLKAFEKYIIIIIIIILIIIPFVL